MLSPQLRRKIHDLWSLFWSSGLSNPLVAIEQITYLLFIRQLEALDRERVKQHKASIYALIDEEKAKREEQISDAKVKNPTGSESEIAAKVTLPPNYDKCRWSYIRQNVSFPLLNETVFPWLRSLEGRVGPAKNGNTTLGRISGRLNDAYFILDVNKTDTLKRAVSLIDELFRQLDTRSVNSDIMGDIFEYLLEEVKESGKNGQFRTPRHVIRFMVQLLKPELGKTILDPACGSGGFLLNALLQWKADNTDKEVLRLEWDGTPHDVLPVWPDGVQHNFSSLFHGYDNDRTMVRIAWMNLILHDLETPEVHQLDSLSKRLTDDQSGTYDYILANPPFTGSVDEGDLSENRERFPRKGKDPITTKSELLFVWLMLDLLKIGGRAAVIVPDGVLFGGTNAHCELRRQLLFKNTLEAVVSLPANMFQPYSGVKTSILLFQKAGATVAKGDDPRTREVWFYEITDEAFSLDQKRKAQYGQDNDLWDALVKFDAWSRCRQGETAVRADAVAKTYHQPDYWEERWRSVDDECLAIFPDKSGDKGHTYPLHELWPEEFPFDLADPRGARQYDAAALARVRPAFEKALRLLVEQTVAFTHATAKKPDPEKARTAAEKTVKAVANALTKKVRTDGLLDREFDQFGQNALKSLLKEMADKVGAWAAAVRVQDKKPKAASAEPDADAVAAGLAPLLTEFAKLDGYNVWRRGAESVQREGKLTVSDAGEPQRVPALMSWIVPVRAWAELESWGEDPKTHEMIAKPTHKEGVLDPEYAVWLRDTLKVFDDDGTVKPEFLDRLDPDCLEALDFNLSAGRHKPFVFDAGQHRPPAELIGELQAIHGEVQKRLGKLLTLVGEAR
ncbi:MAG: class I SAM-dependent DNA methyltransferase [Kiritimatiellia bacterium]|jgi:type I restriction enzyme M protein|nr:class I SAM-dependent DNA methyltransferase [Kiritimatiellia bacterium]